MSEIEERIKREWLATHAKTGFEDLYEAEWDRMIEAVRAEEREKAAQIAEENLGRVWVVSETPRDIATRIREQGKEHDRG